MKTKEITEDMELDESTVFRRLITPWYDSNPVCWIIILMTIPVFIFAITGLKIAITTPHFNGYIWFPFILTSLSFMLIISVIIRMIRGNSRG